MADSNPYRNRKVKKHLGEQPRRAKEGGRSKYRYCSICRMPFLDEEIREGMFDKKKNQCVRCIVASKAEHNEIVLPPCYSISYDGSNTLCTQKCQVSYACMIDMIDRTFDDEWTHRPKRWAKRHGVMSLGAFAERILRAVGRPMHVSDLGPAVEREMVGRFRINPGSGGAPPTHEHHGRRRWQETLRTALIQRCDIVDLGGQFFVWKGCWDLADGGEILARLPVERAGLSVRKLFERINLNNVEKNNDKE